MTVIDVRDMQQDEHDVSTGAKRVVGLVDVYTQAIEVNSMGLAVYVGLAAPGTAKSAAGWQIKKMTFSGSSTTDVQWADGTSAFTKVWDDRAGYVYS